MRFNFGLHQERYADPSPGILEKEERLPPYVQKPQLQRDICDSVSLFDSAKSNVREVIFVQCVDSNVGLSDGAARGTLI